MKPDPPLTVRRLYPADWEEFRRIRLRALRDAPQAFSSTLEEALLLDQAAWRSRLAQRAQFMAMSGQRALGTVGGIEQRSRAELISMWVDPAARGTGVGDRLVRAVLEWARTQGHSSIFLWVAEGNLPAERLYARHGFARTGKSQPLNPGANARAEFEMSAALRPRVG